MSVVSFFGFSFWVLGYVIDQGPSRFESETYRQSPGWVQDKISHGLISEEMTIEQCRLSWSGGGSYFQKVRSDSRGWELWRVENGDRWLYLHVKDGMVDLISEYRRY